MMSEKKNCFIIMPITTPESIRDKYRDGADHFHHVLECLLIPSVERANFIPIRPTAKGSDLIHAEIINKLESADLVLCDTSTLNPNVFFEFGIRSALNKPVCVVKDELTEKVPFDTGILNYHEYRSALNPWELEEDINKLTNHIDSSFTGSKGTNTFWRYLGAKFSASPAKGMEGSDDKLDLLFLQMDSLRQQFESLITSQNHILPFLDDTARLRAFYEFIKSKIGNVDNNIIVTLISKNEVNIEFDGVLPLYDIDDIRNKSLKYFDYHVRFNKYNIDNTKHSRKEIIENKQ